MSEHIGNLVVTKENIEYAKTLTSVGGVLYIRAECSLPVLTSVGGSLYIRAECSLPVLTSVGGYEVADEDSARRNIKEVARAALADGNSLEMQSWHTCETSHCLAGWAAVLLPGGREIEEKASTCVAGNVLLGVEASKWFLRGNNDETRKWLKGQLGEAE